MFVDASAMVAILRGEPDGEEIARRLEVSTSAVTSPLAVWETVVALTRDSAVDFDAVQAEVGSLPKANAIRIVPVTTEIGALAIEASRRFGRGRHPAALNFGDCFAYACARHHGVPLLFKGDDFPRTDVAAA